MDETNDETPYDGAPYMGISGPIVDEVHDAFNSNDINYVARRGFAVNVGGIPLPDVQLPFITISADKMTVRARDQLKDVLRGVQLHLSPQDCYYAEIEPNQPTDLVDAVIKFAKEAKLAPYDNLTHAGPMPVYAMCMKDEQSDPILAELEQRMTKIKEEARKPTEE